LVITFTAFDDQTSTFIIPSGAGFEVIFCPGARSTNILATQSEKMLQLAQQGHVSKDKRDDSIPQDHSRSNTVLVRSGAMRGILFKDSILVATCAMAASILAYAAVF
jgi:hypothetical protein